jgi:hypothetical protein
LRCIVDLEQVAMQNLVVNETTPHRQEPCTSPDEVTPAEIAAVEAALNHLEKTDHKRVLGQIAQWFLILKMYKHLEVSFQKSTNRDSIASKHRAVLCALMGFGEWFWNESDSIPPGAFALISYSRESLAANLRYLREKYEQWFVEIDDEELTRVWSKLTDESDHVLPSSISSGPEVSI